MPWFILNCIIDARGSVERSTKFARPSRTDCRWSVSHL